MKTQNKTAIAAITLLSANLFAQGGNELIFENEDGKKYGINRLELETYPPEEAENIKLVLTETFGEPTMGELNRETGFNPTRTSTLTSGGLTESRLQVEFGPIKKGGFLTSLDSQAELSPLTLTPLTGVSADPSFPVAERFNAHAYRAVVRTGIQNWKFVKTIPKGDASISWNWETDKVPGPAGSQAKAKVSVSGKWKRYDDLYKADGAFHTGTEISEYKSNFGLAASAEIKVFWGDTIKHEGRIRLIAQWEIEIVGEIGVKGSLSTSVQGGNHFIQRNDSHTGKTHLNGRVTFTVTAYGELKIKAKVWALGRIKGRHNPFEFELSAGVEISGSASLQCGFEGKDWDHFLDETHDTKTPVNDFRMGDVNLSYAVQGYVKIKIGSLEIKPGFSSSGSKTFNGTSVVKFGNLRATDRFM